MSEQPETPFFPVPVRWFEIPMNTARWGFMRPSEISSTNDKVARNERVEQSVSVAFSTGGAPAKRVGQLLNERA